METKNVTVAGKVFTMPILFSAGDEVTLTEGQASQFNQVYHENLRNNIAKKVAASIADGSFDHASWQAQIDKIADEYEFGTRRTGGLRAPSDPVAKEALKIATDAIKNYLRNSGKNPNDYKAESLKAQALLMVEKRPDITEKARAIVESRQTVAVASIGEVMAGLEAKPTEHAQAAE